MYWHNARCLCFLAAACDDFCDPNPSGTYSGRSFSRRRCCSNTFPTRTKFAQNATLILRHKVNRNAGEKIKKRADQPSRLQPVLARPSALVCAPAPKTHSPTLYSKIICYRKMSGRKILALGHHSAKRSQVPVLPEK